VKIVNGIDSISIKVLKYYVLMFCLLFSSLNIYAQELEPRSLTNIPLGTNFVLAGYGYVQGNVLFDPALPLDDTQANLNTIVGAYARSVNIFGFSGKVDVVLPYGIGDWTGVFTGVDTATSRSGFGDVRFRISFNFLGAPALKREEFAGYEPDKVSGFSLRITAPTGQYLPDRLINLGSNRWVFKPQWGFSKNTEKWIVETYLSAWFFTKNSDFWGGNEIRQKPMFSFKVHGIRRLPKNMWMALSAGYAIGARGYINDELKDNRISTMRFGLTYAVPIGKSTIRLVGLSGVRLEKGPDFDSISILYQYRFNGKS